MDYAKYIRLMVIYIIGVVVIGYGLFSFLIGTTADDTSNSFYMMFSGLVVATAGSIYGHNKIAGPGSRAVQEAKTKGNIKEKSKDTVKTVNLKKGSGKRLEELKKLESEEKKRLEELRKEEEKEMKRLEEERKKEEEAQKKAAKKAENVDVKQAPASATPEAGVVKVIVCPSCGEENKYTAKFCDNCGKRLRP